MEDTAVCLSFPLTMTAIVPEPQSHHRCSHNNEDPPTSSVHLIQTTVFPETLFELYLDQTLTTSSSPDKLIRALVLEPQR